MGVPTNAAENDGVNTSEPSSLALLGRIASALERIAPPPREKPDFSGPLAAPHVLLARTMPRLELAFDLLRKRYWAVSE